MQGLKIKDIKEQIMEQLIKKKILSRYFQVIMAKWHLAEMEIRYGRIIPQQCIIIIIQKMDSLIKPIISLDLIYQ